MACIESVTLQATDPAAAERFYAAVFELDAQLRPQASEHRVENLEIWSKAQPCGQRVVNKLAFAVEMLDRSAVELWSESFTDRELSRAADAVKLRSSATTPELVVRRRRPPASARCVAPCS